MSGQPSWAVQASAVQARAVQAESVQPSEVHQMAGWSRSGQHRSGQPMSGQPSWAVQASAVQARAVQAESGQPSEVQAPAASFQQASASSTVFEYGGRIDEQGSGGDKDGDRGCRQNGRDRVSFQKEEKEETYIYI
jgi:hypothetical protein